MKADAGSMLGQGRIRRMMLVLSKFALLAVICLASFGGKENSQEKLKVATCQFPVSGDIKSNADYIKRFIAEAAANKADIVHFSEAALTGYPPQPRFD